MANDKNAPNLNQQNSQQDPNGSNASLDIKDTEIDLGIGSNNSGANTNAPTDSTSTYSPMITDSNSDSSSDSNILNADASQVPSVIDSVDPQGGIVVDDSVVQQVESKESKSPLKGLAEKISDWGSKASKEDPATDLSSENVDSGIESNANTNIEPPVSEDVQTFQESSVEPNPVVEQLEPSNLANLDTSNSEPVVSSQSNLETSNENQEEEVPDILAQTDNSANSGASAMPMDGTSVIPDASPDLQSTPAPMAPETLDNPLANNNFDNNAADSGVVGSPTNLPEASPATSPESSSVLESDPMLNEDNMAVDTTNSAVAPNEINNNGSVASLNDMTSGNLPSDTVMVDSNIGIKGESTSAQLPGSENLPADFQPAIFNSADSNIGNETGNNSSSNNLDNNNLEDLNNLNNTINQNVDSDPNSNLNATNSNFNNDNSLTNQDTEVTAVSNGFPYSIEQILQRVVEVNASDLHLSVGYPPMLRIDGVLQPLERDLIVTEDLISDLILPVLPENKKELLEVNREVDLAYELQDIARFRINAFYEQGDMSAAFRLIPSKIRSIEELKLPPVYHQFAKLNQGFVLVTGPTGHGKSTTIASIIQEINENYGKHIITIEDPIEYIYPKSRALVAQREMHEDTHSWEIALRSAMREDPDVVLVGEMRDFETIAAAITLAETGHLVFATLHTNNAAQTIDRIIDVFPENQQAQVRTQLASTLEAVISQRLIPLPKGGRRAASEVLISTSAVKNLIREGKSFQIDNVIRTSADLGMQSMEQSLVQLVRDGEIRVEDAENYALYPDEVIRLLKRG